VIRSEAIAKKPTLKTHPQAQQLRQGKAKINKARAAQDNWITDIADSSQPVEKAKSSTLENITCYCLMGLFALQVAWFQRETLATYYGLKPIYTLVCQVLPCQLPPFINIAAIKSTQLQIRSHAKTKGVLIIDTVIINNAEQQQPYPLLHFAFSDINDRLMASRAFKPEEYLGGELADSEWMPPNQPIRLSLEVIDPGQEAVNYQLRFLQATTGY